MASIEEQRNSSDGLQIPGLVQSQEAVEQLSFTADPLTPVPLATASQPSKAPGLMTGYMTPRPISQAGIAEINQPMPAGYTGRSNSLPGLEDIDTAHQPIARAEAVDTQAFQAGVARYAGRSSSLSGLEDIDTAHQPIAQVGSAPALDPNNVVSQPIAQVGSADAPGSSSAPALDPNNVVSQPISLTGPSSAPGLGNNSLVPQPISQAGLERVLSQGLISPGTTRVLRFDSQAGITRTLEETPAASNTTASRPPVVIRGNNQQNRVRSMRPPQGRRHVISLVGILLLLVITTGMLILASPLGQDVRATLSAQPLGAKIIQGTPNNMSLVAQATATAVVHQQNDGYDPTSNGGGPVVTGSPRPWPLGVCTYWANSRYHELSGHWVTWTGNAYQWADGARMAGWHVSTSPHVPSIIVLMPGVEGASGYGHVAVVESASGDSVHTSNMNWYANGGGWDRVSYYTFTAGSGVYFIWA